MITLIHADCMDIMATMKDKDYFEAAKARLERHQKQQMFDFEATQQIDII